MPHIILPFLAPSTDLQASRDAVLSTDTEGRSPLEFRVRDALCELLLGAYGVSSSLAGSTSFQTYFSDGGVSDGPDVPRDPSAYGDTPSKAGAMQPLVYGAVLY